MGILTKELDCPKGSLHILILLLVSAWPDRSVEKIFLNRDYYLFQALYANV